MCLTSIYTVWFPLQATGRGGEQKCAGASLLETLSLLQWYKPNFKKVRTLCKTLIKENVIIP